MSDWHLFRGNLNGQATEPHDRNNELPLPPSWRPSGESKADRQARRAAVFQATAAQVEMVNAALYLRRPLLVTGKPGTGKTSLAYAVAEELKLGEVLYWPITTRTTLKDGLYSYDAIGRLQDTKLNDGKTDDRSSNLEQIGQYITLGALGTSLLPSDRPRLLLIDEIDKSDLDLPNDLLHAFEEGSFQIPELQRISSKHHEIEVRTADGQIAPIINGEVQRISSKHHKIEVRTADGQTAPIVNGEVRCKQFPLVILTSNGERDFPAPFLRRCLRLDIPEPGREELQRIAIAHLGQESETVANELIERFLEKRREQELATDQLLNAIYLVMRSNPSEVDRDQLIKQLLKPLSGSDQ